MVGFWRLKWSLGQLAFSRFRDHRATLTNPWEFYRLLLLKLVPRLYSRKGVLVLRDGKRVVVDDFMTLFVYNEIFVDKCYDWPAASGNPEVLVDVGANTGLFALRMAQLYPDVKIVCYEPFPPNFRRLVETIEINGLENVVPVMKGVGGSGRRDQLYIHPSNMGGHSIRPGNVGHWSERIEIDVIDLSSAFENLPSTRCDILKLDCEGAEKEIIDSLTPSLARRIPRIVVEPSAGQYDIDALFGRLRDLGYQLTIRQGLLFAEQADG